MNILQAAKDVVERWDTPLWKDVPATAEYINSLRHAIEEMEKAEPVGWAIERENGNGFKYVGLNRDLCLDRKWVPLYAHPVPVIHEGWKLVPKEPTDEMCYEGQEDEDCTITNGSSYARALYKAMLAAAPEYKP